MNKRITTKQSRRLALVLMLSLIAALTLSAALTLTGSQTITVMAASPWAANTAYKVGDQVTYNGSTYQCIQSHTSQVGWEPPNVPALWGLVTGGPTPTATTKPTATATPKPTTAGPTATPTVKPTATATPKPTTAGPTATPTVKPTATATPKPTTVAPTPTPCASCGGSLPHRILVGYWHNFDNGTGFIKLRDVPTTYDVVDLAFGVPSGTTGTIVFTPYSGTSVAELQSDVSILHSRGKKVVLSMSGYNDPFTLTSASQTQNFISSVTAIIQLYNLDGIDLDLEQNSISLNAGDTDFKNPTSPDIVNMLSAVRTIRNTIGANFILSLTPETFYVQVGYTNYGGLGNGDARAGGYLPLIYGLRDILTYLDVQDYNSGPVRALDGTYYNMGGADFHVAMTEMLLQGFTVASTGNFFPALRPDQVVIGVPATSSAGSGYLDPSVLAQAFNALTKGTAYGGSYHMINAAGYPNLRGFMDWSINWDAYSSYSFSNAIHSYFASNP